MDELRLAGIEPESVVDGPGNRMVIFVQGCPFRCPGCHNPEAHDPQGGYAATVEEVRDKIERAAQQGIDGITFSGGEPFAQAAALAQLAEKVKAMGLHLVTFSGYTFEQLMQQAKTEPAISRLLQLTDILVDGPFRLQERDLSLLYRGSRNQRLLDVPASLEKGEPVAWVPCRGKKHANKQMQQHSL